MSNETDSPKSGIATIQDPIFSRAKDRVKRDQHKTEATVSRMMRMLTNHRHPHARVIILAVYQPDTPAHNWEEVWDDYLASKLEKFQNDPCGWVLTLDNGNMRRLIKLSEGY
jgi:hypothetical protein